MFNGVGCRLFLSHFREHRELAMLVFAVFFTPTTSGNKACMLLYCLAILLEAFIQGNRIVFNSHCRPLCCPTSGSDQTSLKLSPRFVQQRAPLRVARGLPVLTWHALRNGRVTYTWAWLRKLEKRNQSGHLTKNDHFTVESQFDKYGHRMRGTTSAIVCLPS